MIQIINVKRLRPGPNNYKIFTHNSIIIQIITPDLLQLEGYGPPRPADLSRAALGCDWWESVTGSRERGAA